VIVSVFHVRQSPRFSLFRYGTFEQARGIAQMLDHAVRS
jgi:hypothetical protein